MSVADRHDTEETCVRRCGNCGTDQEMPVLLRVPAGQDRLVTGAGTTVPAPSCALRCLCPACGAIEAVLIPANALLNRDQTGPAAPAPASRQSAAERHLLSLCEARFGLDSKGTMLDVACGDGLAARRFAHRFQTWKVIGVDPGEALGDDWPPAHGRPGYLRDAFDPALFAGQRFDVIFAQGDWTATPPLTLLNRIRTVCHDGTLISLAPPVLETDPSLIHRWDQGVLMTGAVLARWTAAAGFEPDPDAALADDQAPAALIVRPASAGPVPLSGEPCNVGEDARAWFETHRKWWRRIEIRAERARSVAAARGHAIALAGVNRYTAILSVLVPGLNPVFIVDDAAKGTRFLDRPVVSRGDARERPVSVLVCDAPDRLAAVNRSLGQAGLNTVDLTGDTPLSMDATRLTPV